MTAILYVVDDQWGSHVGAKVMMGVCCEPKVAIYQGHKRQGLLMGRELQFLVREKKCPWLHDAPTILSSD